MQQASRSPTADVCEGNRGRCKQIRLVESGGTTPSEQRRKRRRREGNEKKGEEEEEEEREGDTHKPKAAAKEETFGDGQVKSNHVELLQFYGKPSNIEIDVHEDGVMLSKSGSEKREKERGGCACTFQVSSAARGCGSESLSSPTSRQPTLASLRRQHGTPMACAARGSSVTCNNYCAVGYQCSKDARLSLNRHRASTGTVVAAMLQEARKLAGSVTVRLLVERRGARCVLGTSYICH